jgi:uncharacterized protein YndB with AHSA1/START domain/DNA-binding transcriptional ArsR family regulator
MVGVSMDDVFRALGDRSRRKLLDRLERRDGQTLSELCEGIAMTRFGVMKHLRLLEEAGLITTRKHGREKLHYLNPVPIRLIHDRWVSKFREPFTAALTQLKSRLEAPPMSASDDKPQQVYTVFIRTTPAKLWQALTDGDFTQRYFHGTRVRSSFEKGAPMQYLMPDGSVAVDGEVVECDPLRKLVHTWIIRYDPTASHEVSRVTWLIEQRGASCKLTAIHELENAPITAKGVAGEGWGTVLSGLKTLLETGQPLDIGPAA